MLMSIKKKSKKFFRKWKLINHIYISQLVSYSQPNQTSHNTLDSTDRQTVNKINDS